MPTPEPSTRDPIPREFTGRIKLSGGFEALDSNGAVQFAIDGTTVTSPGGGGGPPTGPAGGKLSGTYPNPGLNAASTDLSDSAALARLASPALTGAPTAPTAAPLDSSTKLGTTAYADAAVAVEKARALGAESVLAPKASPTFTGTTTAPEFTASGLSGATAATRWVGGTASGAPASGTFAVGDFVVDQSGKVWVCTVAGTPGTWIQSGGASVPATVAGGNLGATPSLNMAAQTNTTAVWLTGTLTANATLTITNLTAGASAVILLTQDATGYRSFSITAAGSTAQSVPVLQPPGTYTVLECFYDGTDLYVEGL